MTIDVTQTYDAGFLRDELYAAHLRIAELERLVDGLREENAVLAGDVTDMDEAIKVLRAMLRAK